MLFLLLLFLLLPYSSLTGISQSCPNTSACLLFHSCNSTDSSLEDSSTQVFNLACENDGTIRYIWIAFEPLTAKQWSLDVSTSFSSLVGHQFFFGEGNQIEFVTENTVIVSMDGMKREIAISPLPQSANETNENLHAQILFEDPKIIWLDQFGGSNISMNSINWTVLSTPLISFWEVLKDKTPCFVENIDDSCGDHFEECEKLKPTTWKVPCNQTLWMNEGTIDEVKWRLLSSVECAKGRWEASIPNSASKIEVKSKLICSATQPVSCEPQEVMNEFDVGWDKMNATRREVRCREKFWLGSEGFLYNDWQLISQMRCQNGSWEWKPEKEERFKPYEKEKLACSFETPQLYKAAFFAVVGGSGALGIIIGVIIGLCAWCFCCRGKCCKKSKNKRKSSSATETEGEISSLGVKINRKKAERLWSWSKETRQSQESSSNVSSAMIPESSGEEENRKGKRKSGKKQKDRSGKNKR